MRYKRIAFFYPITKALVCILNIETLQKSSAVPEKVRRSEVLKEPAGDHSKAGEALNTLKRLKCTVLCCSDVSNSQRPDDMPHCSFSIGDFAPVGRMRVLGESSRTLSLPRAQTESQGTRQAGSPALRGQTRFIGDLCFAVGAIHAE